MHDILDKNWRHQISLAISVNIDSELFVGKTQNTQTNKKNIRNYIQ